MPEYAEKIHVHYVDDEINQMIKKAGDTNIPFSFCYSHNEEPFLSLNREITLPRLPIHHDINKKKPEKDYIITIREYLGQLLELIPGVFKELIYVFDPADIHHLNFMKLYRVEQSQYLYLMTVNLLFNTYYHEIVQKGTNDLTPSYKTNALFLKGGFIPVDKVITDHGQLEYFQIRQTISETWIGEKGRGYLIQGIWMDDDLTKFFSKLFLDQGRRLYPYYPFVCKYRTICQNVIKLSADQRKRELPYLHRAIGFLTPNMTSIQQALKNDSFSEELKIYQELKRKLPGFWKNAWKDIKPEAYLNKNEMREFKIAAQL